MLYQRVDHLELRRAGEEMLVHDLASERIHVLNQTAGDVLEQCSPGSPDDLVRYLCSRYDVTGADVDHDVREILERFVQDGLVRPIAG